MIATIEDIGRSLGRKIANTANAKIRIEHLTPSDYEMWDRIFDRIDYEKRNPPQPQLVDHFALQEGWQPNRRHSKTVSHGMAGDVKTTRHLKPLVPSTLPVGKL